MKLTLQIRLYPTKQQENILMETIVECNKACNEISQLAWDKKVFGQYKLHHEVYHLIKNSTRLSAQSIVRCISKVTDAYRVDKKVKREFRLTGGIAYDGRILSYKGNIASIWTVTGRIKVPFICYKPEYVQYIKGECDLICKGGKFYLYQTIEIPVGEVSNTEEFIGVDFGQTDIAVLSDGSNFNSETLKKVRKHYAKVRTSVQSKGTKGSKRLLKRLSGRERRFVAINNHTIAKRIVAKAHYENKCVAIEDLSGIRKTAKPKSKAQKTELNQWSFYQLRQFMSYKCLLKCVRLVAIPPAYTSKTCNSCQHIGDRNGKRFCCKNCGHVGDADLNAALNIATWGRTVIRPENSTMYCALHYA